MYLLISVFLALSLFGWVPAKHASQADEITAIHYIVKIPIVLDDGRYENVGKTTPIYYYKNMVIYQLPYTFDSSILNYDIEADTMSQEHIVTETRYRYFVYRQGSRKGIWYRSMEQLDSNKLVPIDSILKFNVPPTGLRAIVDNPNYTLIERIALNNGNDIIEKYIPKTKPDESYNDTSLFYYSKSMNSIQFSLSPFLDSLKTIKLCKVRLAYNEAYSKQHSATMPQRDIIYEIQKVTVDNPGKINMLFQRFERDEKK